MSKAPVFLTDVNLSERWALTVDGQTLPIVRMLDEEGDETDDPAEAMAFIAGEAGGARCWRVADFTRRKTLN